jgi:hypothetical protein
LEYRSKMKVCAVQPTIIIVVSKAATCDAKTIEILSAQRRDKAVVQAAQLPAAPSVVQTLDWSPFEALQVLCN